MFLIRRFFAAPMMFVLAAMIANPALSAGKTLSLADQTEIRGVIEGQLAAFRADDAATAYGYASDSIQFQFGDAGNFLSMVRNQYYPVYRPSAYQFMDLAVEPGGIFQPVLITKNTGDTVIALYKMEKDDQGRWRIAGCMLIDPPGAGA